MAELIDFEYNSKCELVSVLIDDDGDVDEFVRVRWIPVTERLPHNEDDVLVYVSKSRAIDTGYYSECGYWTVYACMSNDVTHWMPLPSAPDE